MMHASATESAAAPADTAVFVSDSRRPPTAGAVIHTRVLHLVNGEHFSGAERVQSHLGRCLPQFGVAADFACVKPGRFTDMLDQHEGEWGIGYRTPMRGRFDVTAAGQIRDLVRQHDFDLLHAHTPRTAMIAALAARMTSVPWIYHVHSPAARDSARQFANRVNAMVERLSLKSCSQLITVSESLRNDTVDSGYAADRVTVVHNGVPAIRPSRAWVPTPESRWTIGMVALMRPRKGLEVVLDALAKLKAQGLDIVLRCIGPFETPEYHSRIKEKIAYLGLESRVESVGFTDDVPAALAKLDAMVLPSLFGEGLPMVVLEAMAAGLPVIATRVEGTPEAITDGVEGLLAEPTDHNSLAEKIRELVTGRHDWSAMAEAASKRHAAQFSDLAMARGTAGVYRTVLERS